MNTLTLNSIDRVRKIVENDEDKNNKLCICIDYDYENDIWIRYSFYLRKWERSEYFNIKKINDIEEVKKEMITICENYGSINYMCFDYDKELCNFNIYE